MSGQCVIYQFNMRSWRHTSRDQCVPAKSVNTYFSLIKIKEQKYGRILKRKLSKTCSVHHYDRNYLLCCSNPTCVMRTVKYVYSCNDVMKIVLFVLGSHMHPAEPADLVFSVPPYTSVCLQQRLIPAHHEYTK